jgi:hypothetical protein
MLGNDDGAIGHHISSRGGELCREEVKIVECSRERCITRQKNLLEGGEEGGFEFDLCWYREAPSIVVLRQ